jgi:hypothetical protein
MQITFDLADMFGGGTSAVADARLLTVLLEALIDANLVYLRDHAAKSLYRSGVVYARTRVWDTIPALYSRGYGDCKSLSAALCAEMRHRGEAAIPVFRWKQAADGSKLYHILVQTSRGWEDPSRRLGMGRSEWSYFQGR